MAKRHCSDRKNLWIVAIMAFTLVYNIAKCYSESVGTYYFMPYDRWGAFCGPGRYAIRNNMNASMAPAAWDPTAEQHLKFRMSDEYYKN